MADTGWKRCQMSNEEQMLAWLPNDKGYPGAVVCIGCSFGVLIKPGTQHEATSQAGNEFYAGTVEPHDVNATKGEMRYTSKRKGGPLWQTPSG